MHTFAPLTLGAALVFGGARLPAAELPQDSASTPPVTNLKAVSELPEKLASFLKALREADRPFGFARAVLSAHKDGEAAAKGIDEFINYSKILRDGKPPIPSQVLPDSSLALEFESMAKNVEKARFNEFAFDKHIDSETLLLGQVKTKVFEMQRAAHADMERFADALSGLADVKETLELLEKFADTAFDLSVQAKERLLTPVVAALMKPFIDPAGEAFILQEQVGPAIRHLRRAASDQLKVVNRLQESEINRFQTFQVNLSRIEQYNFQRLVEGTRYAVPATQNIRIIPPDGAARPSPLPLPPAPSTPPEDQSIEGIRESLRSARILNARKKEWDAFDARTQAELQHLEDSLVQQLPIRSFSLKPRQQAVSVPPGPEAPIVKTPSVGIPVFGATTSAADAPYVEAFSRVRELERSHPGALPAELARMPYDQFRREIKDPKETQANLEAFKDILDRKSERKVNPIIPAPP